MPRKKSDASIDSGYFNDRKFPTAKTEEARENQMVELAMDLAEHRLRNGTATSQEVVHFLKLGSVQSRLDLQTSEKQLALIDAKTKSIESADTKDAKYEAVIKAMRKYRGESDDAEEE